ncbi:MAG: selenide, water dikinase SelD [Myxococcota bacterium]|nr:selenide, water dikinase SelD [Myxococcota bacterium]
MVRLTQFSQGAGCGCKIAPAQLDQILEHSGSSDPFANLLVGAESKDDAAVVDLRDGSAIVSTTDFFMPIVDDPFQFGQIAAANALSDVYAMGATPIMAIAILGWPVEILSPNLAGEVIRGGRSTCTRAGIPLAGGHSIVASEPIFGLAVTGRVALSNVKKNSTAQAGDVLFLTKPIGVGVLATAQKRGHLADEDLNVLVAQMCRLNHIGPELARVDGVTAMTDVTGFGLLGHLLEMCRGANLRASLNLEAIPRLNRVSKYIGLGCVPGGTHRNRTSYGDAITPMTDEMAALICDPQTSGGLLIAVRPDAAAEVAQKLREFRLVHHPIGHMLEDGPGPSILLTEPQLLARSESGCA